MAVPGARAAEVFDGLELAESLPRAAQWARRHGVDAMGVRAALAENGAVRDDTRRIWAQAEYLRMLAVLGEREALAGRSMASAPGSCMPAAGTSAWMLGSGGARRYAVDLAIPPGDLPGGAVRSGLMRADAGHMGLMWG